MRRTSLFAIAAITALGVIVAGCGSPASKTGSTSTTVTPVTTPTPSSIAPIPAADRSPAGRFGIEPQVVVPPGAPPTVLESADLIVGTGAEATAGKEVSVQYVGVSYHYRKTFSASWTSGGAFQFFLGEGQVIPGWDQGVVGMKVGGRRELIIPPTLGYGADPTAPGIAVNDTLIFVVDLISVG